VRRVALLGGAQRALEYLTVIVGRGLDGHRHAGILGHERGRDLFDCAAADVALVGEDVDERDLDRLLRAQRSHWREEWSQAACQQTDHYNQLFQGKLSYRHIG